MGAFKSYFGLWFFQGALLQDKENVLINAQEGKTKALRQWRFASKRDIDPRRIKAYLMEAIALAEAKRAETKIKRLAKIIPMILANQGLNDKYRN